MQDLLLKILNFNIYIKNKFYFGYFYLNVDYLSYLKNN